MAILVRLLGWILAVSGGLVLVLSLMFLFSAVLSVAGVPFEDVPTDDQVSTIELWLWTFGGWALGIGAFVAAFYTWRRADRFANPS